MINEFLKLETETFGEYIKRIRLLRGYSQRELATLSSLSSGTIYRIENGENYPESYIVINLAEALKLDKDTLLVEAGYINI
ncbi:helix-turn-helix domain-containing protein [Clostridium felsineum]|uniref:helix-turn-helix domain-containing protein n=1 Tax=Clostridium felsineum TaxID=36839 RepID=UPI00098CAA27|nr:helix-turn-helix transcriptional regulator [Clostridium felsineum]URZ17346.1 HTH-type transcriptional repressor RghR [Clostridium felsineum DSM 794]